MTHPDIPKRLWAICNPHNGKVVALVESHTAEQACGIAAVQLGWNCGAFLACWLPAARAIGQECAYSELEAENVTGLVPASASFEEVQAVIAEAEDRDDWGRYMARDLD